DRRELLRRSLETGRFDEVLDRVDETLRPAIAARIGPVPSVAQLLEGSAELTFARVWPQIRLITTWTGGSCGIALDRPRATLPADTAVMELGYQSPEFRGTIALAPGTPAGLPPLGHHFFEFVRQAAWDDGRPEFLTLDQLEDGTRYYAIVTTASGLYRY